MKTALLLLGGFLCGLHGAESQDTDLLIIITKVLNRVQELETKDQTHQSEVQSLKNQIQDLETKDQSHQREVQALQREVQSLKNQIQTLENSQFELQTRPRVAFFAGFYSDTEMGNYGPFDNRTTIKYKKVVTNVGGAYSADTGKFTAPLKGLYVFTFIVRATDTFVTLMRNTEILGFTFDSTTAGKFDTSTGGAVVALEAGDTVYMVLERQTRFYGYHGLSNSFSGFLLSPM